MITEAQELFLGLFPDEEQVENDITIRTVKDVFPKLNIALSQRLSHSLFDVDIDAALEQLKKGDFLYRYPRRLFKIKGIRCFFHLDTDTYSLKWVQTYFSLCNNIEKTKIGKLPLADVLHILPGIDCDYWKTKKSISGEAQLGIELLSSKRLSSVRILCPDVGTWKVWLAGLLFSHSQAIKRAKGNLDSLSHDYIRTQWELADLDNSGTITFGEMTKLLRRLQMPISKEYAQSIFNEYDLDNNGSLDYGEFRKLITKLMTRNELQDLFIEYRDHEKGVITPDRLSDFFVDVQKEYCEAKLNKLIQQAISLKEPFVENGGLTDVGFNLLMSSEFNSAFEHSKRLIYQDMSRPITEYWIASSHNTYLTGDQLTSKSEIRQYINVLLKGCRCVELDIWDGSNGEPIIYHGHTLTSQLLFSDVIIACKDYGFRTSPYPIILSLEMHVTEKQKEKVAEYLIKILGDMIYIPPPLSNDDPPSPESLKYKFLVKAKIPKNTGNSLLGESAAYHEVNSADYLPSNSSDEELECLNEDNFSKNHNHSTSLNDDNVRSTFQSSDSKIFYSLVSLPGKTMHLMENNRSKMTICSLDETKFQKISRLHSFYVAGFHKNHLSRIYPSGCRILSTNYNPMIPWFYGAQIVALNYQVIGSALFLNEGRFRENGGHTCGYVLKPEFLRLKMENFDPLSPFSIIEKKYFCPIKFSIKIISAHQLPMPIADLKQRAVISRIGRSTSISPFVSVSIFGGPLDECKSEKTSVVANNGFNPEWKDIAPFTFHVLCPEISILVVEVRHSDGLQSDYIAASSIPIHCIRPGIRWIQLFDQNFRDIQCCGILADISIFPEHSRLFQNSSKNNIFDN